MKISKTTELPMLIANAGRLLHQRLHDAGAANQPSMLHFKILRFVAEHGTTSMKDIAAFLGVTPPSATVLVNRLVRSRELTRVAGAADRRTVQVALTPEGRKNLDSGCQLMVKRLGSILSRLSGAEKKQLTSILKHLLKAE